MTKKFIDEKICNNQNRYLVKLYFVSDDLQNGVLKEGQYFAQTPSGALLEGLNEIKKPSGLPLRNIDIYQLMKVVEF